MDKDILDKNLADTEVVEVQETIQYHPALLESRNEYISGKVQALYASYGVNDSEGLISSIKGESEALELDTKVSNIKELHDKYIPAVFQLGIRGFVDPNVEYEKEVIWSEEKMGVGVESFVIDFKNNLVVRGSGGAVISEGNLHILDSSNGYTPTKIWSEEEMGVGPGGVGMMDYILDLGNNILVRDGWGDLQILNRSNNYKPIKIESTKGKWIFEFKPDLENNIVAIDGKFHLLILDSSDGYKPTEICFEQDSPTGLWEVKPDLENNIVGRDGERNLYILNKAKNYKPTKIWSVEDMGDLSLERDSFKLDLKNNIVVEDRESNLHFLDSSNNYKSTKIWSEEDMDVGIKSFKFDLENNIWVLDSNNMLNFLESSNNYKFTKSWIRIEDFQIDLKNNIVTRDGLGKLQILDSSNDYKGTYIGFVFEGRGILLDYEGNIIISSRPNELNVVRRTLSILRPKKNK